MSKLPDPRLEGPIEARLEPQLELAKLKAEKILPLAMLSLLAPELAQTLREALEAGDRIHRPTEKLTVIAPRIEEKDVRLGIEELPLPVLPVQFEERLARALARGGG